MNSKNMEKRRKISINNYVSLKVNIEMRAKAM